MTNIKLDQNHTTPFPKFVVFQAYPQPHVWSFDDAKGVANLLQGADLRRYAMFRDGVIVHLESAAPDKIEGLLTAAGG